MILDKITRSVIAVFALMPLTIEAQDEKVMQLGKETFTSCSLCHGPDGKGAMAGDLVMAPNLHESAFVKSKAEPLVAVILKGIHKEDNKYLQVMVPLEEGLSDEQIAAVSTYVRSEFGGRKNVIDPKYVKKVRADYRSRTAPWKRSELVQLVARTEAGPLISNLKYSVYEGKWEELPDFSTLEPVQRGTIQSNKITLKHSDDYEFSLWALNEGTLIINGENVLLAKGENASNITKATEKLEAGEHTFKIHCLYNGSKARLAVSMESETLGEVTFSDRTVSKGGKKKQVYPRIILTPENGEAIAVGYPDGMSLSWNAATLNLSQLWRGGFLDVAPHWNHRGSSSQPMAKRRWHRRWECLFKSLRISRIRGCLFRKRRSNTKGIPRIPKRKSPSISSIPTISMWDIGSTISGFRPSSTLTVGSKLRILSRPPSWMGWTPSFAR